MMNNLEFFKKWKFLLKESKLFVEPLKEVSILKNKHPFKVLYILGPPGAGKTFVSKQIGIPSDFKVSNPDIHIEKIFPLFNISLKFVDSDVDPNKIDIELLQQVSRTILQKGALSHTDNLLATATPLIFDTTGEDFERTSKKMNNLNRLGYDVGIIIVNVPPQVSVERDALRKRTVGAKRVAKIANEFQNIIKNNSYAKLSNSHEGKITLLGETFTNIFDLKTGNIAQGIDKKDLQQPLFQNLSVDKSVQILAKIKNDLNKWLGVGILNEKGKIILAGMQKLVQASKGRLGQNMNDLILVMSKPEFVKIPEIKQAAELLTGIDLKSIISAASGKYEKEKAPLISPSIRHAVKKFKGDL